MKKRLTALVLCAAVLLTACSQQGAGTITDISNDSSLVQDATTAGGTEESKPAESVDSTDSNESKAETTASATSQTTAATSQTTAAVTEGTMAGTTAAATTAQTTPAPAVSSQATTEKKPEATPAPTTTKKTETTTAKTTTAKTTTEKKPEPAKPQASSGFTYDAEDKEKTDSFGIDISKRISYYDKIVKDTTLPIIHVTTEGGSMILSNEEYTNCLVDVLGCDKQYMMSAETGGIKVRGNSTAYYGDVNQIKKNQVPYRIKFDSKQNMLGLNNGNKFKSWVLLKATWCAVPDYTAFKLAKAIMNGEYYSSDCTTVWLYVNEQFAGLYLLCEQQQINKNRVNINEVEEGYTGTDIGYFVELDNYAAGEEHYFTVDYCGATVTDINGVKRKFVPSDYSFKNDIYSQKQVDFIQKYISGVFEIMTRAIIKNQYYTFDENYNLVKSDYKTAFDTINAVADLNSIVDMYILHEICHSNDCGEGSFYMAVDFSKDSKMKRLTFTAPWDFNWAYENLDRKVYYAAGFNDQSFVNSYGDRSNPWFVLLMSTDWFKDLVSKKWQERYSSIVKAANGVESYINSNFEAFNIEKARRVEGVYAGSGIDLITNVKKRISWLNRQFS